MGIKKAKVSQRGPSSLEIQAGLLLRARGMSGFLREQKILAPRRFEFDFVWPTFKVTLEVHGGQYLKKGRHQTASGFARDRVKMNLAQLEGWLVIEACTDHVKSGEFTKWVADALSSRGWIRSSGRRVR